MEQERLNKECAEIPAKLFRPHVDSTYFIMRATYFSAAYCVRVVMSKLEPAVIRAEEMLSGSVQILSKTVTFSQPDRAALRDADETLQRQYSGLKATLRKLSEKCVFLLKRVGELLFIRIPAVFFLSIFFVVARIATTALYFTIACSLSPVLFTFFTLCTVCSNAAFVIRNCHAKFKTLYEKNIAKDFLRFCGLRPEGDVKDYFSNELKRHIAARNDNKTKSHQIFPLVKASVKHRLIQAASLVLASSASTFLLALWLPVAVVMPIVSIIIAIPAFVFSVLSGKCSSIIDVMDVAQKAFGTDTTVEPFFMDRTENQEHCESVDEQGSCVNPRSHLSSLYGVNCFDSSQQFGIH